MKVLQNTLYVMTEGSYLNLDHETVVINAEDGSKKQHIPLHHLGSIVCIGNVRASSGIMAKCAADGRSFIKLDRNGDFLYRIQGPVSGNVLLRCNQHQAIQDTSKTVAIARSIVAGKIQNCRNLVLRGARDSNCEIDIEILSNASKALAHTIKNLESVNDNLNVIRGMEGEAAHTYFGAFESLIKVDRDDFYFKCRSRRPPRDRVNAMLSFLYALLCNDCVSALEGVGLDPQIGFLHAVRPGKPALALDMMEELRPLLADRICLTLINRRQVTAEDFEMRDGGAVYLSGNGKKTVVVYYQKRKKDEVMHPLLDKKIPIGLLPHIQARILARLLRGDTEAYIPFIYK
ncbi:MAG: type I-C CRISPR-associated endonuclease Cas1c [Syntrophaceticus schinkii]|jgi:CRISPR-associated protein Cas1|nr:type I-C CRISPR-associated endonuclease Cas1c [Syntrophaceticus schinkii]MDD4261934.1 type I-C CRISPR-associated endonuclease Cas1c [Syntrophaceticus schinkii]